MAHYRTVALWLFFLLFVAALFGCGRAEPVEAEVFGRLTGDSTRCVITIFTPDGEQLQGIFDPNACDWFPAW